MGGQRNKELMLPQCGVLAGRLAGRQALTPCCALLQGGAAGCSSRQPWPSVTIRPVRPRATSHYRVHKSSPSNAFVVVAPPDRISHSGSVHLCTNTYCTFIGCLSRCYIINCIYKKNALCLYSILKHFQGCSKHCKE